jgi:hypothetical protein
MIYIHICWIVLHASVILLICIAIGVSQVSLGLRFRDHNNLCQFGIEDCVSLMYEW